VARFVDALFGQRRFILDYMLEDVLLAGQPAPVQDFLLRTSIWSACAPRCARRCFPTKTGPTV
jgi:ATP/maltotriose-dependent transcriptional regulator MalT